MQDTIEVKGLNGQLELTDSVLRIKRKGVFALMTQGLKGDKEIRISQISSVQLKNANILVNGYIQFAFMGGQEAKGGLFEGANDENTVVFRASEQAAFVAFKDELQRRIAAATSAPSAISPLEELEKLASLRDRGIVTEEEFLSKKKQLLGV